MTVKTLHSAGVANAETARLLGVSEGTVRYPLRRQALGTSDGRARQVPRAAAYRAAMEAWLESEGRTRPHHVAALHAYLVEE